MYYKINSIVLLILLMIKSINGNLVSITTNYTLNTLKNFNESLDKCKNNPNCPLKYPFSGNRYDDSYLCIEDETKLCRYVNGTVFSAQNDKLFYEYKDIPRKELIPILKTCDISHIEDSHCKNPYCENDNECFSGKCHSNVCITDKTIYLCTPYVENNIIKMNCGKQHEMKCEHNEECYSEMCNSGFCENFKGIRYDDFEGFDYIPYILIGVGVFILIMIIFCVLVESKHRKN